MRNIVVIKYHRNASQNYGSHYKEDASFCCMNGEHEAKTLRSWLKDNLIEAEIFSKDEWEMLPTEHPLTNGK